MPHGRDRTALGMHLTLKIVKIIMLLQGNQKYHAKELKLKVSNKTLIKSVIIIFKSFYFYFRIALMEDQQ